MQRTSRTVAVVLGALFRVHVHGPVLLGKDRRGREVAVRLAGVKRHVNMLNTIQLS